MFRFNRSQDKKLRANLTIVHRIGLEEIACAIHRGQITYGAYPKTKKQVEEAVVDMMKYSPPNCGFWDDASTFERTQALELALKFYPQLERIKFLHFSCHNTCEAE